MSVLYVVAAVVAVGLLIWTVMIWRSTSSRVDREQHDLEGRVARGEVVLKQNDDEED